MQGAPVVALRSGGVRVDVSSGVNGGGLAVFDSPTDGIVIQLGSFLEIGGPIYGSGNAGRGINFGSGCSGSARENAAPTPTITGVGGDFALGGTTADGRAWNPGANAYTAPIAMSWANFDAAVPGGFGGNAHQLTANAHLVTFG